MGSKVPYNGGNMNPKPLVTFLTMNDKGVCTPRISIAMTSDLVPEHQFGTSIDGSFYKPRLENSSIPVLDAAPILNSLIASKLI